MSDKILYGFDKSIYKSEQEIGKEYDEKVRKFLKGRTFVELSKEDQVTYMNFTEELMRDPRQRNMYYSSKEAAITAKHRADKLDGIKSEGEPEIITYTSDKPLKLFNWTPKSAFKLIFKK